MKKTILPFLFLCLLHTATSGSTLYVNAAATGANNRASWADAFTDLQLALAAAVSGDQIWVAAGTYKPATGSDLTVSFVMVGGVAIYGGFPGTGDPGFGDRDWTSNVTTLSGDIGTAGSNTDNSYHVINNDGNGLTSTSILDGFTISGGNANLSKTIHSAGGGMYNYGSSPTVSNCTFSGNSAIFGGGGMYNQSSSPSVTNCTFSGNSATGSTSNGGGMCNNSSSFPTVSNCTFSGNSGANGGGMYSQFASPTVSNCTFSGNMATSTTTSSGGGGMYNFSSSPSVTNCTFSNNTTSGINSSNGGGGMYNSGGSPSISNCTFSGNSGRFGGGMYNAGSPTLTDCVFSGNSATTGGGGINSTTSVSLTNCSFLGNSATNGGGFTFNSTGTSTLTNCLFLGNSASSLGGGFQCTNSGSSNLVNCSFSGNTAPTGGAVRRTNGTLTLVNCILWGNSTETNGTMTITYSIVQGGYSGTGNLDADPEFVSQPPVGLGTAGDLHLSTGSAAYNAGNNAAVTASTDLDGLTRIALGTVDIGAYESQSSLLPVELVSFSAKVVERSVQLTWQTASESNNEGFDVQRSTDGRDWQSLGFVPGNGTTTEAHDYSFLDEKPTPQPPKGGAAGGVIYYRLRQTDFDGAAEFSQVVSIEMTFLEEMSFLRVYPNPVGGSELTLVLPDGFDEKNTVQLFNPAGQLALSAILDGGSQKLNVSHLAAGIYTLRVGNENKRHFTKIVVQD